MPASLRKQLGPFTVGVWLLIVVGGLALGLVVRRVMGGIEASDAAQQVDPAAGTPAVGTGFLTQGAAAVTLNGGGGYGGNSDDPKTNDDWVRYATSFLVGRGQNALEVDTALRRYVNGLPMTTQDGAIVSMAILLVGPPPEPVAPADVTTPVPGTPTPPTSTPKPPTSAKLTPEGNLWVSQALVLIDKLNRNAKMSDAELSQAWGMGIRPNDPQLNTTGRQIIKFYADVTGKTY